MINAIRKAPSGRVIASLPWIYLSSVVPDGTTDNAARLGRDLAQARGKVLQLPAGVIALTFSEVVQYTLGAAAGYSGTTIRGAGRHATTLRVTCDAAFHVLFNGDAAGVELQDVTVEFVVEPGGVAVLFNPTGDDWAQRRIRVVGNVADAGGSPTHEAYPWSIPAAMDVDGVTFEDVEWVTCTIGLLKTNAATSANERIAFRGVRSVDCYAIDLLINSPNGSAKFIEIDGVMVESSGGVDPIHHAIGIATAEVVTIANVQAKGSWWRVIHLEERVQLLTISNVVADLDEGDFIGFLDNDVGGADARPEGIVVSNFAARKLGANANTGVQMVFNGSGITSGNRIQISDGHLENFAVGLAFDGVGGDLIRVDNVTLRDCAVGIQCNRAAPIECRVALDNCAVGVQFSTWGGIVKGLQLKNVATIVQKGGAASATLADLTYVWDDVPTAGGGSSTFLRLTPGTPLQRANCTVSCFFRRVSGGADYATEETIVDWDGTTVTVTPQYQRDGGGFAAQVHLIDEATAVAIAAPGAGYSVNDLLTASGGTLATGGSASTFRVTSVGGGGEITGVELVGAGEYNVALAPTSPNAAIGGGGAAATLTITYTTALAVRVFNNGAAGDVYASAKVAGELCF